MVTSPAGTERRRAAYAYSAVVIGGAKMEVFVKAAVVKFSNWTFPEDSVVGDLLTRFVQRQVGTQTKPGRNVFVRLRSESWQLTNRS